MNRWIIDDYSDEEDKAEEEEFKCEIQIDAANTNQQSCKIKNKKNSQLNDFLERILYQLSQNNLKKALSDFNTFQNIYRKPPKVFKKKEAPLYFISKLYKITQIVKNLNNSDKIAIKLEKDISKFNQIFEAQLDYFEKHQLNDIENFDFDIEDNDDESNDNTLDKTQEWFIKSDDNDFETEKIDKNISKLVVKPKSNIKKNFIEDKREIKQNKNQKDLNDDIIINKEIEEYGKSRVNGKIKTTVSHLYELYQMAKCKELIHKIQLEICLTVDELFDKQLIPLEYWSIILNLLPYLLDEAPMLVPLFEKINKDYWARSIYQQGNSLSDITVLYEMLPKFITNIEKYKEILRIKGEFLLYVKLEMIFIEQNYYKNSFDIMPNVLNILEAINQNIFNELIASNIKQKIALFLAYNLSIRNYPISAADVLNRVPKLTSMPCDNLLDQILSNRTLAQIGIAAFTHGNYKLTYKCLFKICNSRNIEKLLGQKPSIYPPWMLINTNEIIKICILSSMFLNIPYLTIDRINTKIISIQEYQNICTAIQYAKYGNWEKASSLIAHELGNSTIVSRKFLTDLKEYSFKNFMMTAGNYFETILLENLIGKFELQKEVLTKLTNDLICQHFSIDKIPIKFNGMYSPDNKYLIFDQNNDYKYIDYSQILRNKFEI